MEFSIQTKHSETAHHMVVSKEVIAVVDDTTTIHYLDPADITKRPELEPQEFKSPVTYQYTKANSSSNDGKCLCLYLDSKKKTFLCTLDPKIKQFKPRVALSWSTGVTEVSEFSFDNKLLAVGGADGLVTLYSTANGKVVNSLPRQGEYITSIAFSSNNRMVAYASFKKLLVIFDLTKGIPIKITGYNEIISVIGFLHKTNFLIYGARDNAIVLFDILNGRTLRELGSTINWPMAIYVDKGDQYALISDKAGYVHIVDLTSEETELEPFYNSDKIVLEIKSLGNDYLYFLFEDGSIKVVNIKEEMEKVLEEAAGGSIAEIYKAITINPILRYGVKDVLAKNDELFLQRLDPAMEELAQGNIDTSRKIMGKSIESPLNKEKFDALIQHRDKVVNFWQMVNRGEYAKAYDLSSNGDFYKKLPFYEKLEKRFSITFKKALTIMLTSKNLREAQTELSAFMKIPVKMKGIKAMMDSPNKFANIEKSFEDCDYEKVNKLLEAHPELKESPFYSEYKAMIDDSLREFAGFMTRGAYSKAIEQMKFIKGNFPDSVKALEDDFAKLKVVEKFNIAVENKQFTKAMELASENTFLIAADEYVELDKVVGGRLDLATRYAFAKKFAPMDKLLRPFLKSKYSRNRAIGIYKIFYIEQIEEFSAKMKDKHWKHTIESYVLRFGYDQEIDRVAKKYDKDTILESYEGLENASFLKYKAVANIVTGPIVASNIEGTQKIKQQKKK